MLPPGLGGKVRQEMEMGTFYVTEMFYFKKKINFAMISNTLPNDAEINQLSTELLLQHEFQ